MSSWSQKKCARSIYFFASEMVGHDYHEIGRDLDSWDYTTSLG